MSQGIPKIDDEPRFATLFEQAPFSVQLLSVDGRTIRVNKAWEAMWQVSDGDGVKEYVLGEYNILSDPQLDARGVTPHLRRAFEGESVELPMILYDPKELGKAGRARWVRAFAHPIKGPDGKVLEVMLIHEDVTDRQQSEHALRASELRLQQLANTIPQLAWMADPSGWIHWYNDRWYEYTGTTPEQMAGWGWQSVHDPAVLPQVMAQWKQSIETGAPFQMTFPLRGTDGRFRPFFTLIAPLKDPAGAVVQWFGTNTDVSALQETEQNLRNAEERLRLATFAGQIGIWEWDIERDVVSWSDEVYALHGIPHGSFGGRAEDFVALIHPDDREMLWERIQGAKARGDGFSGEFRTQLPDGGIRWLSAWARIHRAPNGSGTRMIGALISVDAYKKAEAALIDSDRRKDEFLAMLAHELRNPLAPIGTAAEILQRMHAGDETRLRQTGEVITRQVRHITKLVDDLLDVSRVTHGRVQLDQQVVDLASVVHSAVEQVSSLLEAKRHALTTKLDGAHACVLGDRTRLIQVIVNLLSNAARYTPEGGRIEVSVQADGESASLRVSDNGVGIDSTLLPHVFELFTQGPRLLDRSQGGLGIGLALVKRLVELHGGRVQAESAGSGQGSVFTVTLPLTDAGAAASNSVRPHDAADPTSYVMLVDDNRDAADSLASLLESMGHRVEVHYDAAGALASSTIAQVRVFILDIGLPDIDGHSLARALRRRNVKGMLVALSGYGLPSDRALSMEAGFDHHFVKPVDWSALAEVLARA